MPSTLPRLTTRDLERGSVIAPSALARRRILIQTASRDQKPCPHGQPWRTLGRSKVLTEARRCRLEVTRLSRQTGVPYFQLVKLVFRLLLLSIPIVVVYFFVVTTTPASHRVSYRRRTARVRQIKLGGGLKKVGPKLWRSRPDALHSRLPS